MSRRGNSFLSEWSQTSHGYRQKKSVSFNPVVEYFYYDKLDTTPVELRRLDLENGPMGRLLSFRKPNLWDLSYSAKGQS